MRIIRYRRLTSLPVPQNCPVGTWLGLTGCSQGKWILYIDKMSCKVDDMETLHPGLKRRYIEMSRFVGFAGALAGRGMRPGSRCNLVGPQASLPPSHRRFSLTRVDG
jgi:hypothetical protein